MTRDPELARFKTDINLTEYAASRGYALVPRETSRNSVAMRHPDGDKIIIARGEDGNWIYFSIHRPQRSGSVIDFVQQRDGVSLGGVRKILREYLHLPAPERPPVTSFIAHVEKTSRDRQAILRAVAEMATAENHPYLQSRGLPAELLASPRFVGRVLADSHGAAVFIHEDADGVCGFEHKNHNFTGFAAGGVKGLWKSHPFHEDRKLIVCESAIDALSYARLHPDDGARYVSTAGAWSPQTGPLLRRAAEAVPGGDIVLAFDDDEAGRGYEAAARAALAGCPRRIVTDYPTRGKDWNEALNLLYGVQVSVTTAANERVR
jgi:hypothetical protein